MTRGGLFVLVTSLALAACGDNILPAQPDAGPGGPPDATPWQIAPHPAPPQVISNMGPVAAAPVVVPIFFTGDDVMQGQIEEFLKELKASTYWHTTTSEYGVGDLTIAPTVVATDTPMTSDQAYETWLATMTDGTHDGWPKADVNHIYAIFLPPSVTDLTDNTGACTVYGGYHYEAPAADTTQPDIVYAILPRCAVGGATLDPTTEALSHELVEAATDPLPATADAWDVVDDNDTILNSVPGGELGDMCEYVDAAFTRALGNFKYQRTWSNASAAAGHDPCVPQAANTPYLGVAPVLPDTIALTHRDGTTTMTHGIAIPQGMSKTIEVDLFSDAPSPDWTVTAIDVASQFRKRPAELSFSWDKQSGHNGDKLMLTITHTKAGRGGGSEFLLLAGPPGTAPTTLYNGRSSWFGLVGN